jgi:hypothetical protein
MAANNPLDIVARGFAALRQARPWLLLDEEPRENMIGEVTRAISGTEPTSQIRFRVSATIQDLGRTLAWRLWTAAGRWLEYQPPPPDGEDMILLGETAPSAEEVDRRLEAALPCEAITDAFLQVQHVLGHHVQLEYVYTPARWHVCFAYGEAGRYMVSAWLLHESMIETETTNISNRGPAFDRDWLLRPVEERRRRAEAIARSPFYEFGFCSERSDAFFGPRQSATALQALLGRLRRFTVQFVRLGESALDAGTETDLDYQERLVRPARDPGGRFDRPVMGRMAAPPKDADDDDDDEEDDPLTPHPPGAWKRSRDGDVIMRDDSEEEEEEEEGDSMNVD